MAENARACAPDPSIGKLAAAACGAVLVWSTNALAAGAALEQLTLAQVLALQFGGAATVIALARSASRSARPGTEGVRRHVMTSRAVAVGVVGLSGTIALQYLAFATAPLIAANAIAYAWPLMVVAWTAVAPSERGSWTSLVLTLVGFAGVIMVFGQGGGGEAQASSPVLGYAAALASAVAMAWYTLAAGRLATRRTDLLVAATGTGAAIAIPVALVQGAPWSPAVAVALGLYAGLGPMAAGYALWTHAMSHPGGIQLAPIAYGTPLLSTLVLLASGERLETLGLIGCGLIVLCSGGVVVVAQRSRL